MPVRIWKFIWLIAAGGHYAAGGGETMGGAGAHPIAHQPNSLDDLDGETLPFDDVPIRYDTSGEQHSLGKRSCSQNLT